MQMAYERMMGLRKREKWEVVTQGVILLLVAMVNLHQLPLTQIADLGTIGLQHGAWPFVEAHRLSSTHKCEWIIKDQG